VMKMSVSPAKGCTVPSGVAALSKVLRLVLPTAAILWPALRARP